MRTIESILHVHRWTKDDKTHYRTYALLKDEMGNLDEAQGYGADYKAGQRVECWFNDEWDYYQMQPYIDTKHNL